MLSLPATKVVSFVKNKQMNKITGFHDHNISEFIDIIGLDQVNILKEGLKRKPDNDIDPCLRQG